MMAKFDKYSKWLAAWIPFALSHCFVPTSCTKDETIEDPNSQESVMLFGVENIAQTKVSYGDQTNGASRPNSMQATTSESTPSTTTSTTIITIMAPLPNR